MTRRRQRDRSADTQPSLVTEEEHRQHRQQVRRDQALRRATSGALLGVIGVNTLAPAWGPLMMEAPGPMETAARAALSQVKPTQGQSALAVRLDASRVARETREIFAEVDARLRQIDGELERADTALGAPQGSTRAALLERVLMQSGMGAIGARTLAHDASRSEAMAASIDHVQVTLDSLGVDARDLVVVLARVADQVASDTHVERAFMLGSLAVLPKVSAALLPPAVRVGQAIAHGFQRHAQAMDHLKHPGTGHAGIDTAGRVVGEAVDLVAHGLALFGPVPFFKLARGADVLLIVADCLAAKTAVAGTTKSLTTYSSIPVDVAAFMLGALSTARLREGAAQAVVEGNATARHLSTSAADLKDALAAGDVDALVAALARAGSGMTASEKVALSRAIGAGVEALAQVGV